MKQTFASIAIIGLFVVMSISDFDIGIFPDAPANWDASQDPQCPDFELPEYAVTGTDMACLQAVRLMKIELDSTGADCLFITNTGWIPVPNNPAKRRWVEEMLSDEDSHDPEACKVNLEIIECQDCPFTDLAKCPQCVKIFEERMED